MPRFSDEQMLKCVVLSNFPPNFDESAVIDIIHKYVDKKDIEFVYVPMNPYKRRAFLIAVHTEAKTEIMAKVRGKKVSVHLNNEHSRYTINANAYEEDRCFKTTIDRRIQLPSNFEMTNIYISRIHSVNKVYVQLKHRYDIFVPYQLEKLQNTKFETPLRSPDVNHLVVVRNRNGQFYRAKVVAKYYDQQYLVFLVDTGFFVETDVSHLFSWSAVCNRYPFQAILCSVDGMEDVSGERGSLIRNHLRESTKKKTYRCVFLKQTEDDVIVSIDGYNSIPPWIKERQIPIGRVNGIGVNVNEIGSMYIIEVVKIDHHENQYSENIVNESKIAAQIARNYTLRVNNLSETNTKFKVLMNSILMKFDGNGCGLALTVAYHSAIFKRAVDSAKCFTGEVSLTGRVSRIDGLIGKLSAALDNDMKTFFIPIDNLVGFKFNIDPRLLEIKTVSSVPEVLDMAFSISH
ncbi:uncharacterized protein LOC116346175 [Contarinia nasturtii]|uniref:uncharacterized protein LOC116346175 n=1 Tax=Contarinia nasturtii TaxID=265458 RepID=UPI0012D380B7|nr:uncharacterized protein LOC116346175 [Contarinia nasturtii]